MWRCWAGFQREPKVIKELKRNSYEKKIEGSGIKVGKLRSNLPSIFTYISGGLLWGGYWTCFVHVHEDRRRENGHKWKEKVVGFVLREFLYSWTVKKREGTCRIYAFKILQKKKKKKKKKRKDSVHSQITEMLPREFMGHSDLRDAVISDFRDDASEKARHMCSVLQRKKSCLTTFIFFITNFLKVSLKNVQMHLVCGFLIMEHIFFMEWVSFCLF